MENTKYVKLLEKVPTSYKDLEYEKYRMLTDNELFSTTDTLLDKCMVISILTEIPVERVRKELNAVQFIHILEFISKNLYESKLEIDEKSNSFGEYKIKSIEELTTDDFITLSKIDETIVYDYDKMSLYLNLIIKDNPNYDKITIEDIKKSNTNEVLSAFFLSMTQLKKSMKVAYKKEIMRYLKILWKNPKAKSKV